MSGILFPVKSCGLVVREEFYSEYTNPEFSRSSVTWQRTGPLVWNTTVTPTVGDRRHLDPQWSLLRRTEGETPETRHVPRNLPSQERFVFSAHKSLSLDLLTSSLVVKDERMDLKSRV